MPSVSTRLSLIVVLLASIGCTERPEAESSAAADTTAATAPSTDIYLAMLTVEEDTLRVEEPENITQRPGYDNQPHFTPDGTALLYTSVRDGQADTYRYDLAEGTTRRVTDTPESEYSPTSHEDGFSVVRVEKDGTQRLWQFAGDGSAPTLLLPDVAPVGYHAWPGAEQVVLFVLGDPPTLQLVNTRTGAADTLARDVGRSLQGVPGRATTISFVQHTSDSTAQIRTIDARTQSIEPLIETLPGGDFHAWTPDGRVLMAQGSTLFQYDPARNDGWQRVADLAPLRDITRLAVHPRGDRLALVAADASAPSARASSE